MTTKQKAIAWEKLKEAAHALSKPTKVLGLQLPMSNRQLGGKTMLDIMVEVEMWVERTGGGPEQ